jgi:ribosomal protein S12 methylthiotransferase
MIKIAVTTLGCPKNLVDSEALLAILTKKRFEITDDVIDADVFIINTCGFLKEAEQEALDIVFQAVELKKTTRLKKIILAGCLAQRYGDRLFDRLEQVDAVVGVGDFFTIGEMIERLIDGKERIKRINPTDGPYHETEERILITPPHYAYLKISEGCNHKCSFCVIPQIKGRLRSRDPENVVRETKQLVASGVREIIVVAQDTTEYLRDKGVEDGLTDLLRSICSIEGDFWVRALYTYPAHWTDSLIKLFASEDKLCKYVDMPMQHVSDGVLTSMGREDRRAGIESLIDRMRNEIEDLAIRTSMIVGYPGESEQEFDELLGFMESGAFERLGAFIYSPEEGTRAAELPDQVPDDVKEERFDRLMLLQQEISLNNNRKLLEREVTVLIDEKLEEGDFSHSGRTQWDAPDVDGNVYLVGKGLVTGRFVKAAITGYMEYDLVGEVIE